MARKATLIELLTPGFGLLAPLSRRRLDFF
jgi:hypothetical protein